MWTPWSGGKEGDAGQGSAQASVQQSPPAPQLRPPPSIAPSPAAGVGGPVSRESALEVITLSVGFSAASGLGGALYGVLRQQPALRNGLQYGFNTFVFAFPILAMRQYVVTPMLDGALYSGAPRVEAAAGYSMHLHNVAASTLAGAIGGGAMSAYQGGRAKLVPGTATFAVLCAALQLSANELRIVRIKLIARRMRSANAVNSEAAHAKHRDAAAGAYKAEPQSDMYSAAAATIRPASSLGTPPPSAVKKQKSWLPFRSMPDDEYEAVLLQQREDALQQLRKIDIDITQGEAAHRTV